MGFVHWVYIMEAGGTIVDYRFFIPDADNRVFAADKVDGGVSMTWTANSELGHHGEIRSRFQVEGDYDPTAQWRGQASRNQARYW